MAYLIPMSSVLEVQYRYTLQSQQCINVFHYVNEIEFADGAAAAGELADDFIGKVAQAWSVFQTVEVANHAVRAQWVNPVRYQYVEHPFTPDSPASAAPTLSIGTAAVLRRRGEVASRSTRGRVFLGGLPVSQLNIGTWIPGALNTLNTQIAPGLATPLAIGGGDDSCFPIIWSYTDPLNKDRVSTTQADPYARYQRRREVGRGI